MSFFWPYSRPLKANVLITVLLHASVTMADLFVIGISPKIQDPFINPPPTSCPVAQDGYTYNAFPWSHNPTCANVVVPSTDGEGLGVHRDFCVYTNSAFNGGRGISIITEPEIAAELTGESFRLWTEDEETSKEHSDLYELKEVEGKGLGLVAKEAMPAGKTLIVKAPVLFVSREALNTPSRQRRNLLLNKAVEQLPESTQKLIMVLAKSRGGDEIEDIVKTNGVAVRGWTEKAAEKGHFVVTPELARVNHACRPNAFYRFNDFSLMFGLFALKDIEPGEEITVSYGFSNHVHKERLDLLKKDWGFTCHCSLCSANSSTIAASDARLKDIASIKDVLPNEYEDIPQLLGLLPNLISLLDEEDLHTETPMYEEIMAYTWSSFGIEDRAKHWASRARQHWDVLAGRNSFESRRTRQLEMDVKNHGTWATWEGDPWEKNEEDDHHHH